MSIHAPSSLLGVMCLAILPPLACAQNVPAACRPVIDAGRKQIMTPHHSHMIESAQGSGGQGKTSESIGTADATYVVVRGKWTRSPMDPKETLEQMQENLATAKAYSCQHVGDESVNGVAAVVYTAHSENEGVVGDSRTWIAKSNGLPIRQEEDMTVDGAGKRHFSIRWEYGNVRAPAEGSAP